MQNSSLESTDRLHFPSPIESSEGKIHFALLTAQGWHARGPWGFCVSMTGRHTMDHIWIVPQAGKHYVWDVSKSSAIEDANTLAGAEPQRTESDSISLAHSGLLQLA